MLDMKDKITAINYRNARIEDIPDIMKVECSAFSRLICEEEKVFIERIKIFPEGFKVMETEGKIIGYICSERWIRSEEIHRSFFTLGHSIARQHFPDGSELYISSMGVIKEYHGLGLGRKLFENFLEYADLTFPGIGSIILVVAEKWNAAKRLYSDNGFREIKVFEGFFSYREGELCAENGIVMRKELLQNF